MTLFYILVFLSQEILSQVIAQEDTGSIQLLPSGANNSLINLKSTKFIHTKCQYLTQIINLPLNLTSGPPLVKPAKTPSSHLQKLSNLSSMFETALTKVTCTYRLSTCIASIWKINRRNTDHYNQILSFKHQIIRENTFLKQ